MNEEGHKQTTEGITFRIPSSSIHQLRRESTKKQVSLNTLVNQILKEHLDWHTYAAQARMFHVPRSFFSRIVDKLTDEELSELAVTNAKKDFVDIGLLLKGEFTLTSFLSILENWSRIFSYLIKELYRYILEEMFEKKSDFTITDNTVMFRFREK
jgi:hypothetical protein